MSIQRKLSEFEILQDFSADELKLLSTFIEVKEYKDDEEIIGKDSETSCLLFVFSGKVKIVRKLSGGCISSSQLGKNEIFGEVAFADQKGRSASAISIGDTEIGSFLYEHFEIIKKQDPVFGMKLLMQLMKLLAKNFRNLSKKIDSIFMGLTNS